MTLRKTVLAAALTMLAAGSAQAALWSGDFNTGAAHDGVVLGINGFDVYSNGSVAFWNLSTGFQVDPLTPGGVTAGDFIQVYYQGIVNSFAPGASAPNLAFPGSTGSDSYQLTVAATYTEQVFSTSLGGLLANIIPISGGRISIFYDDLTGGGTAANILAGTGYTDGLVVADGSISGFPVSGITTYSIFGGPSGGANVNIAGPITTAATGNLVGDVVGFMPDTPNGFQSNAILAIGPNVTQDYETNNFFDNANGWAAFAVNKDFTLRGDANVDLTQSVPEPATLALLGMGLIGLGALRGRKQA